MTKKLGQGGFGGGDGRGEASKMWSSYMQADIPLRNETEGRVGCLGEGREKGLIYPRLTLNLATASPTDNDFELVILFLLPLRCWNYRHEPLFMWYWGPKLRALCIKGTSILSTESQPVSAPRWHQMTSASSISYNSYACRYESNSSMLPVLPPPRAARLLASPRLWPQEPALFS